jgi:hypothetical protein
MHGVELRLRHDVAQEGLPPLLHQALSRSAMMSRRFVWRWRQRSSSVTSGEELRLLEGLHVQEVEIAARVSKALLRRCVVCACRQLCRVEGAEGETESGNTEINIEGSFGPRVDVVVARRTTVTSRRGAAARGEHEVDEARGNVRKGEERARGANEISVAVERRTRLLYSNAKQRSRFSVRDSVKTHVPSFLTRMILARYTADSFSALAVYRVPLKMILHSAFDSLLVEDHLQQYLEHLQQTRYNAHAVKKTASIPRAEAESALQQARYPRRR